MSLTITAVADSGYIPYMRALVKSTQKYNPDYSFWLRLINCNSDIISEFEDMGAYVFSDNCNLNSKKTLLKNEDTIDLLSQGIPLVKARKRLMYSELQCYCTHIRFENVCHILDLTDDNIIVLDADTIIRGSLNNIETLLENYDMCARYRVDDNDNLAEFDDEGFIAIRNNMVTKRFYHIVMEHIYENLFDWDVDTIALYEAYAAVKDNFKLYRLSSLYKDRNLNDNSIVWSGSSIAKDEDKFKDEMQKYG